MKIHLFYDVLLVPPLKILKERRDSGTCDPGPIELQESCTRFLKVISLPCLLVPGQTYNFAHDPVSSGDGQDMEIKASGFFEKEGRPTPFMIVSDSFYFAFDPWLDHEATLEERELSFDEQVSAWRKEDERSLKLAGADFEKDRWREVEWKERQPFKTRASLGD